MARSWEDPAYKSWPRQRRSRQSMLTACAVALVGLVLLGIGVNACQAYTATRHVTTTITDKQRVCSSSNNSCKYLVYTNAGTFRLTDSLIIGRFSSSDTYGQIKRCHRYQLDVYGWRLPVLSEYPNIKSVHDLGADTGCSQ